MHGRRAINTRDHAARLPGRTYGIGARAAERAAARLVLRRRLGRRERDFRVAPPPPTRARAQLLDLAPRQPARRLGADARGPTKSPSPRTSALEQLRVQREQEDREHEREHERERDLSENDDGILLIPEGEAGVCVRLQNWSHPVAQWLLVALKGGMHLARS